MTPSRPLGIRELGLQSNLSGNEQERRSPNAARKIPTARTTLRNGWSESRKRYRPSGLRNRPMQIFSRALQSDAGAGRKKEKEVMLSIKDKDEAKTILVATNQELVAKIAPGSISGEIIGVQKLR
jgi:hypothetical protein